MPAPAVLERLLRHYPTPDTELAYRNAFELLIATVLSAQSTDVRVNQTTPALFARYPDARALAVADPTDVEPMIHATGFFRVKSKAIVTLSQRLVAEHGGEVPPTMDALTTLPGVGRKTANVVLGHALGVPGLPVDRHVLRVSNRIGLVHTQDAVAAEMALGKGLPESRWTRASDTLILHGRRICRPRPLCGECFVADVCRYPFKTAGPAAMDLATPVTRGAAAPKTSSARPRDRGTRLPATGGGPASKARAARPAKAVKRSGRGTK